MRRTFARLKDDFLKETREEAFAALRLVRTREQMVKVRQGVAEPVGNAEDFGMMVILADGGGTGYGATCDLSEAGMRWAVAEARRWLSVNRRFPLVDFEAVDFKHPVGEYPSNAMKPWEQMPLKEKIDLLKQVNAGLRVDDRIVDREASLWFTRQESFYATSGGGEVFQASDFLVPHISATANEGAESQTRSLGGLMAAGKRGGLEILDEIGFAGAGKGIAQDALVLLDAPDCPSETMDLLLDPDEMMIQIHESVGHPLEIDRILGDERNYAGTSFVTPEMFGSYRYGSDLMNITFDPELTRELATYAVDDEGTPAKKKYLIEKGILKRGLGGVISQARSGLPGVANARAQDWNRPPIDRIANLNLEPGDSTMEEMIGAVEKGIYMKSNTSWSIDDSRNKFQFGCEWARLIEDGRLTRVVRKPNYRGISANFWRNLKMVGNRATFRVLGTPFCGKGEPNQVVRVGHASPACLFANVDVFGGAS